jgi:Ser/Thr protein kinase RdoA (MazF antagonist)
MLRHNENITCKVCPSDKTYSLRIHCPVEDFNIGLVTCGYDAYDRFRDEVQLLCYMRGHGFPELQEPVTGPDAKRVYRLSDGSPAMLLSWIPGRPIEESEGKKYAEELGKLAAKIHISSRGFSGRRFAYDELLIDRLIEEIRSAVHCEHITSKAGDICIRELKAIRTAISRLKEDTEHYGIIHSDLSFGNVLVSDNELIPIDFSLSGFRCYAQEAGMLQSNY